MARQPRIDFPGAFHHVMNRGADHQITFRNDADRHLFIQLWAKAVSRFGIEVIAYCLMGNHFHLFVHSPDAQLSATMQYVGRAYTQAFNQRHGRDGALFRGRFHSIVVDSEEYFLRVARYIELNPVAAGFTSIINLEDYVWSSFRYYATNLAAPSWLATQHMHHRFANTRDYRDYVTSEVPDAQLQRFYDGTSKAGRVLGTQAFVDRVQRQNRDLEHKLTAGMPMVTAEDIDAAVATIAAVERFTLYRTTPGVASPPRQVAIDLAAAIAEEGHRTLANRYGFATKQAFYRAVQKSRRSEPESPANALRRSVLRALAANPGLPEGLTLA